MDTQKLDDCQLSKLQRIIYNYHFYCFESLSNLHWSMIFQWSLRDSKSPYVSRTILIILTHHENVLVWIVSTLPHISKSSSPFTKSFADSTEHTNYNWYHRHFRVPHFFSSLTRSTYLSFFSLSFSFIH